MHNRLSDDGNNIQSHEELEPHRSGGGQTLSTLTLPTWFALGWPCAW